MTRRLRLAVDGALILVMLGGSGCISMPPADSGAGTLSDDRFDTLSRRGSHQEVLDLVEQQLPDARSGQQRAELLYAQGRAQLGLQRRHSALISLGRALDALGQDRAPLARQILRTQGDAELGLGRAKEAAALYGRAYESAQRGSAEADELAWSAWYALDQAGSASASGWKRKVQQPTRRELVTRERELAALSRPTARETPKTAQAPTGSVPDDPRALLPAVQVRGEWKAAAIGGDFKLMEAPWRITVHHGATLFSSTSAAAVGNELRNLQRFHQKDRGWADLGYHFLIDPAGRVWEGRALRYQGAHAGDSELNRGNIGICVLGNYQAQPLLPAQQKALADTLRRLQSWFGVATTRIYTHAEIRPSATVCPGVALQRWVNDYRLAPAAMMARQ